MSRQDDLDLKVVERGLEDIPNLLILVWRFGAIPSGFFFNFEGWLLFGFTFEFPYLQFFYVLRLRISALHFASLTIAWLFFFFCIFFFVFFFVLLFDVGILVSLFFFWFFPV